MCVYGRGERWKSDPRLPKRRENTWTGKADGREREGRERARIDRRIYAWRQEETWKGRVSYMQLVRLHIFYRTPGAPAMGNASYSCIDERRRRYEYSSWLDDLRVSGDRGFQDRADPILLGHEVF